jgi:hypothetical protein
MSTPRDVVHFLIPQTDTARVKKDPDDFISTWDKLSSLIEGWHEEVDLALRDTGAEDGWSFRWLHLTEEFNVRTAYRRVMVDREAVVFCLERAVSDR